MATIERAHAGDRAAIERVVTAAYTPYIARNGAVPGPMRVITPPISKPVTPMSCAMKQVRSLAFWF